MTSLWFESALLAERLGESRACHCGRMAGSSGSPRTLIHQKRTNGSTIGIPGVPNLHSHAFQRGIAGLTERRGPEGDSFWTWRELMYQFVERIDPDEMEAIAALAYAEMLECGFTQVGEFHYLHHDRGGIPFADPGELAGEIGGCGVEYRNRPDAAAHSLRAQRFWWRGTQQAPAALHQQPRALCSHRGSQPQSGRKLPGGVVGIAPHSLRAVTPEELTWLVELSRGSVIHIHIAEQTREVDDCIAWSGRRPVEWLLEHMAVDERWCLVHATHINDAEIKSVAASGAVVGLCPITEANLGDGIFPAPAFLGQAGRIGIGSDSNVLLDAAEEFRTLEYSQRLAHRGRNVLASAAGRSTGRTLFEAALAGGAQVLRSPRGLEAGASLDVVSLNTEQPELLQRREDDILDSWIFSGGRRLVDCVWRAGEKVVINGRHRHREAITARYRRTLKNLLS